MQARELRTTLNQSGIGTSFLHADGRTYFVSTVENPPGSRQYETLIKIAHAEVRPLFYVTSQTPKQAVINHVAASRMAISLAADQWNQGELQEFLPTILIEQIKPDVEPDALQGDYATTLLGLSGLHLDMGQARPRGLHQLAYLAALILGGMWGYDLAAVNGFLLGLISAIFFAIVCSTLVGAVAIKVFGYRP